MVSFFRKNILTISLMLLPYVILIRIKSLISPVAYTIVSTDTPFLKGILFYFQSPLSQAILAILLIFIQGVMINKMVIKNRICHEQSLVPGLFYVLFVSMLPSYLLLSPQLISVTFLIHAFIQLYKVYGKIDNTIHIFNVGVLLSFSTLIYYPTILFIIVAIIGFIMLKSIKLKGLLQLLIGIIFPYYMLYVYYFQKDNISIFQSYYQNKFIWVNDISTLLGPYFVTIIISAIVFVFLFMYRTNTKAKSIQTQEKIELLYLYMFLFLGMIFTVNEFTELFHIYLMVPIAIFFTLWILRIKNVMLIELIHMSLVMLLFSLHFLL